MKGKKHKATGGAASGDPESGEKLYDEDLKTKPEARTNAKKIDDEAEEKKRGGRAKRKRGGGVKHHEKMGEMKHAKHVGMVEGRMGKAHKGRAARKAGGRTGSNFNPLSSAHSGMAPKGHSTVEKD
jgi:hypothetical protein